MIRLKTMISGGPGRNLLFQPWWTVVLIGLFWSFAVPPAVGSSLVTISSDKQMALADTLFRQAEYDQAIAEYRRFVVFFPDDPGVDRACFQAGLSYYLNRNFEKGLSLFEAIAGRNGDSRYRVDACFMVSRCCLALGRRERAAAVLEKLLKTVADADTRDKACYHLGWLCLSSPVKMNADSIHRADEWFSKISDKNRTVYNVEALSERLQDVLADGKGPLLSQKHPALAGTLAVFPGAGYVYCGRYQDALMSLVLNTAMGYAACEAVDADLESLGGLIGLVGFGFYAGSIYGSISAAHKHNRARAVTFLDRLHELRVETLPMIGRQGAGVRLRIPF